MCGIAGYVDLTIGGEKGRERLVRMLEAIRHRGPDDSGHIIDGPVGLGMQRLSIVDLEGGAQPMSSADGQITLVYNGEIYNHAELRAKHEGGGRRFSTSSDTEVLLAQYERHGLSGLDALNGMFAAAIWDRRSQEVHLIRDRMGVKPIYYFSDGTRLLFASELKALIASMYSSPQINGQAIWDFLTFRYVPAPQTIWENVFKLPPAHVLTVPVSSPVAVPRRWWDMPYVLDEVKRPGPRDGFSELFVDAVNRRMVADVPVGIFLSGGLDSSAVAAAVDRRRFPDLKTFSVSLESTGEDDERTYARMVADHLGTDHHEVFVSESQFADCLADLPWHTDEPLADATCVPVLFLARAARRDVKVVLSGEGSDEILAGYTFDAVRQMWDAAESVSSPPPSVWRKMAAMFGACDHSPTKQLIDQRRVEVPLHITNYLSSDEKGQLFKNSVSFRDSVDVLRRDIRRVVDDDPLHQSLYLYCQNWLVEDLLMKADKMTMAASLELRTPFLDYRLVEWAARAPVDAKLRPLPGKGYETKSALRNYARAVLPIEIIERPKKGFPVPVYRWLSGPLRALAMDNLTGPSARLSAWLNPAAIRPLVERGTSEQASERDRHLVWNLLVLELWFRRWI